MHAVADRDLDLFDLTRDLGHDGHDGSAMISPLYVMLDVDNRRLVVLPATVLLPEAAALAGVLTTTGWASGSACRGRSR